LAQLLPICSSKQRITSDITRFNMEKNLKDLATPLKLEHIEFRIGQLYRGHGDKSSKVFATILAYKNARTDAIRLDEVVGPENWQLKFREEKDCIVASLGIRVPVTHDWVWKEGNGTPGDIEKEKGAYSDAQKRAGFQWGIGRELYDFPFIYVELFEGEYFETADKKLRAKARPQDWDWKLTHKNGIVQGLAAAYKGNIRFNYKAK